MSNQKLYRLGGIAAFLSLLASFSYYIWPYAMALAGVFIAVFVFALYHLFKSASPTLSLVAAVLGIGGALILAAIVLFSGSQNNTLQNLALWTAFFAPPLLFGLLAYQHSQFGMPRMLGFIGILGGALGFINMVLTMVGGGDWSQPNNPALSPLIMGTYYPGMLLTLVWMVWTGFALLRPATAAQRQPV